MERSLINAAKRGEPEAEYVVGQRWHDGSGVPVDFKKSARWFALAVRTKRTVTLSSPFSAMSRM